MNEHGQQLNGERNARVRLDAGLLALRRVIRFNVLLRGAAWVVLSLLGLIVISMLADRFLRLSVMARAVCGVLYLGALGWAGWRWILAPLSIRLSPEVLADLLERRYPELQDLSLIHI